MVKAEHLQEVRLRRGIPIAVLARRAGVSRGSIYLIESGGSVELQTLIKIARAIEEPLGELSAEAAKLIEAVA